MRNRTVLGCVGLSLVLALAGCDRDDEAGVEDDGYGTVAEATPTPEGPVVEPEIVAAQLSGPGGVAGVVTFTEQPGGGVQVVTRVQGATAGPHGLHLHQGASCDGPDFQSAGDHFNPTSASHGGPDSPQRHAGDFGNVEVGADGTGTADVVAQTLNIEGPNGAIGHAVILHAQADDLTTQPSGNSGARVACGVVERVSANAAPVQASPTVAPEGAI
jgi:Cu-Zn family superoxide dismutase